MISVVIPLLNEEQLVEQLLKELWEVFMQTGEVFEVICVDDGSTNKTLHKLLRFREKNDQMKALSLSIKFGLQPAITAGIDYAKGDYVVIMDSYFQDPPELIPELFEKIKSTGADIVSVEREARNEKFLKRIYIY